MSKIWQIFNQSNKNEHKKFKYITKDNIVLSYPTYFDKDKISGNIELRLNNNQSILIESLNICLFGILQNKNTSAKISEKIKSSVHCV